MKEPKYQELREDDESGGLLGRTESDAHPRPRRLRLSKHLLSVALGISVLFNIVGLFSAVQRSNDICIPSPLFRTLSSIEFWIPHTTMLITDLILTEQPQQIGLSSTRP